jgi:hypothetical protein
MASRSPRYRSTWTPRGPPVHFGHREPDGKCSGQQSVLVTEGDVQMMVNLGDSAEISRAAFALSLGTCILAACVVARTLGRRGLGVHYPGRASERCACWGVCLQLTERLRRTQGHSKQGLG